MTQLRSFARSLLPALALALNGACLRFESGDPTVQIPADAIRIAALTDRTGTSATLSYSAAIQLAFKQMKEGLQNSAQSGIQFALLLRDTASKSDQAERQALDAVLGHGARALITEISADTIAVNALNYRENLGVPVNCFACSSSFINNPAAVDADPWKQAAERDERNYLHRLFMNSKYEAAVQMRVAMSHGNNGDANGDGRFKVALIATDDPYGKGWDLSLRTKMMEMHPLDSSVEVMYVDPRVNDTSYNWSTDLSRLIDRHNDNSMLEDGHPDVVFLALLPVGSGAATKAYREAGYDIPLQATTAFRRLHILRSLGANAEGVEGGSPRAGAGLSGAMFEAAFKAEYGEDPEMLSSGAYDCAVTHMLAALVAIGTSSDPGRATPEAIRQALDRINDPAGVRVGVGPEEFAKAADVIKEGRTINYLGATGDTTFDAAGDNNPIMVHYRVENNRFVELETYACDPTYPLCASAPEGK
jgi:ABC-type branched-subunit amino acid transport system substrate-binding protein